LTVGDFSKGKISGENEGGAERGAVFSSKTADEAQRVAKTKGFWSKIGDFGSKIRENFDRFSKKILKPRVSEKRAKPFSSKSKGF
jgi:hypothetical protein